MLLSSRVVSCSIGRLKWRVKRLNMDPANTFFNIMVILLLVAANGFFVAAEFSLVTMRATRIEQLVEEGNRIAKIIQRAQKDPNRFLSASQIGITLASLALGWVAEPTVAKIFMEGFEALWPYLNHGEASTAVVSVAHSIATAVTFLLITYLHIVLGEFIPKAFALQRTEATVLLTALPLELVSTLFTPFIVMLNRSGQWILNHLGIEAAPQHHLVYTEDELKRIVSASHEVGLLESQEQQMLHKVFAFSDKVAREIMVPRPDIKGLPVDSSFEDVVKFVREEGHTRFPIYQDNVDHVVGVFHAKDLFHFVGHQQDGAFQLRKWMRDVPFVPESKAVDELLTELKKGRSQIAIVMDEFGGTSGLVTLEDVLEEIVGEIEDEFDEPVPDVELVKAGHYRIDGSFRIADFNDRFGTNFATEDYDTLAGLVFGALGREPLLHDHVTIDNTRFEVQQMEGHRIKRLGLIIDVMPTAEPSDTHSP